MNLHNKKHDCKESCLPLFAEKKNFKYISMLQFVSSKVFEGFFPKSIVVLVKKALALKQTAHHVLMAYFSIKHLISLLVYLREILNISRH